MILELPHAPTEMEVVLDVVLSLQESELWSEHDRLGHWQLVLRARGLIVHQWQGELAKEEARLYDIRRRKHQAQSEQRQHEVVARARQAFLEAQRQGEWIVLAYINVLVHYPR